MQFTSSAFDSVILDRSTPCPVYRLNPDYKRKVTVDFMGLLCLKVIAIASSETSRTTHPVTQHHIPEDSKPHPHCCGKRKSRKSRSNCVTNTSYFRNSIAVLKVPRLHPLDLQIMEILWWRRVWSFGGMILTEENRSTGRKTCNSATSYTTNPTLVRYPTARVTARPHAAWYPLYYYYYYYYYHYY